MKSFQQFHETTAAADTRAAIGGEGKSGAYGPKTGGFKKRPSTGVFDAIRDRLKRKGDEKKPEGAGQPGTDGPGDTPDRKPSPYRQSTQREKGGALAKRPEEKGSMVQKKTAAAKQPPQHRQISARPASTAMAGSRQRPAIRPGAEKKALPGHPERKAITGSPDRKALPAGQGRPIQSGPQRQKIRALPAARG